MHVTDAKTAVQRPLEVNVAIVYAIKFFCLMAIGLVESVDPNTFMRCVYACFQLQN